jgi:ribonuclease HI
MRLSLYSDGASQGNPGPGGIGGIILNENGDQLASICQSIGLCTNNQAEYKAAIAVMKRAISYKATATTLYMDSQLVVNQINGKYRVKNTLLKPLHSEASRLAGELNNFTAIYIPREKNKISDTLAKAGIKSKI